MENFVFKPEYRLNFYFGLGSAFFIILLFLWVIVDTRDFSYQTVLWLGLLILMPLIILTGFIRSIIFEAQSFWIKKFLFLSKTYEYSEVLDFSERGIRTTKGGISLLSIKNTEDLFALLTRLRDDGKINNPNFEHRIVTVEKTARKALIPSIIITVILWIAIISIFHLQRSFASDIGVFLIFIFIYYFMVKWQSRNKREQ
jgi:hypothetical protein